MKSGKEVGGSHGWSAAHHHRNNIPPCADLNVYAQMTRRLSNGNVESSPGPDSSNRPRASQLPRYSPSWDRSALANGRLSLIRPGRLLEVALLLCTFPAFVNRTWLLSVVPVSRVNRKVAALETPVGRTRVRNGWQTCTALFHRVVE